MSTVCVNKVTGLDTRNPRAAGAFTLVELLVVIALLGILGGMIFAISPGIFRRGESSRAQSEIEAISVALEAYRLHFGDYPQARTPRQLFDALDGKLGPGVTLSILNPPVRPFLQAEQFSSNSETDTLTELLDPWGNSYEYRYISRDPPATTVSGYNLFSKGPDGKASIDGADDSPMDEDNLRYRR